MRKLLLASVAGLSVSMGATGFAAAQTVDDVADDSGQAFPTPGQVTVRLNGRLRFYANYMPDAKQVQTTVAASNTASAANGGQPNGSGTNKIASYGFQQYARLYPGFDGVAANGLKYGAAVEIRTGGPNTVESNGVNVNAAPGGLNGSVSAQQQSRNLLFTRRAYGYVGMDKIGTVRVGATDGPMSLYETGTFENFSDGNWNGDIYAALPSSQQLVWPFSVVSGEYGTVKAVYLSPQFFGFDGGVSFEPNTNTGGVATYGGSSCGTAASIACETLISTPTYETQRRRNTYEVLGRYRGTFGGVGLAATAAYMGSGRVADDGTPRRPVQFQGLNVYDAGATLTFAGVTVGGHFLYGDTNNNGFGLTKQNGRPELAWLAGASYTAGPIIVGASYVDVTSNGSIGSLTTGVDPTGQRREQGIAVGGTYSVAPGFALFATYLWDQRKEGGYNFITGATATTANNKINGQIFGLGTTFAW